MKKLIKVYSNNSFKRMTSKGKHLVMSNPMKSSSELALFTP